MKRKTLGKPIEDDDKAPYFNGKKLCYPCFKEQNRALKQDRGIGNYGNR
jgi:hypothetical protein